MITIERARQIIECYGGNPNRWPETERAAMQRLLSNHQDLQELQRQAMQLDERLLELFTVQEDTNHETLADQILANLPDRTATEPEPTLRPLKNLTNLLPSLFNRPMPAWSLAGAALVMLLALGVVQFGRQQASHEPQLANGENPWLLMAETLDNSADLELLAVLEPELAEDDLDIL
ncbi:hypothetical protein [Methylomarinum vadi]|uniref:hypothetical protein n=1 Tax=Methylomarinum vadi TaxID=438855 RepID=UPI0004DF21EE|nr:hypothetical protein [Methylomarinum vadi]